MMKRRGFIAALISAPVVAKALSLVPKPKSITPSGAITPLAGGRDAWEIHNGTNRPIYVGDVVTGSKGGIIGIAMMHIPKGGCGLIQVRGPVTLRYKS